MDCGTQTMLTGTRGKKIYRNSESGCLSTRNLAVVIARVHAMIAAAWAVPGQVSVVDTFLSFNLCPGEIRRARISEVGW